MPLLQMGKREECYNIFMHSAWSPCQGVRGMRSPLVKVCEGSYVAGAQNEALKSSGDWSLAALNIGESWG